MTMMMIHWKKENQVNFVDIYVKKDVYMKIELFLYFVW